MAHSEQVRHSLRSAYVHQALSLEQAAAKAGVAVSTATRWMRRAASSGDDWDKARAAARLAGAGADALAQAVLEDFITLFQSTLTDLKESQIPPLAKAEAISRLSDAYSKTMSAVGKSAPRMSKLAVAMEMLEMLGAFCGEKYPQHAPALLDLLEPFGAHLAGKLA